MLKSFDSYNITGGQSLPLRASSTNIDVISTVSYFIFDNLFSILKINILSVLGGTMIYSVILNSMLSYDTLQFP